jgi:hypothetical protein
MKLDSKWWVTECPAAIVLHNVAHGNSDFGRGHTFSFTEETAQKRFSVAFSTA